MEAILDRRRFTADEFMRMGEAGIFDDDDRVELIAGEIVRMAAMNGPHVGCVNRLTRLLGRIVGDDHVVSIQNAIRLDSTYVPQPDVAVLRGEEIENRVPTPADVLLVIEVADSTLATDRSFKLPRYARIGIAEVWLINLNGQRVERHTAPGETGYGVVVAAGRGETLTSTVLPALTLAVDAVLGAPTETT